MTDTDGPLESLENFRGTAITVQLKGGMQLEGVLEAYDQHMNLVLTEATEMTIVRGDNVVHIEQA